MADLSPEALVRAVDFRHIADALSPGRALTLLERAREGREEREAALRRDGYPAYITSAAWLGYDEEKVRERCREALVLGFDAFKMKVGIDTEADLARALLLREEIGAERRLMLDANQVWGVDEAIAAMQRLAECDPFWIEEPTHPDDVLGHARIREAIAPIGVATGEHCANRVITKQLLQAGAIDFLQIDGCRLGGVNEVIAAILLAAEHDVPVCPHAGGVGLCEHVVHFSIFDHLAVTTDLERRMIEYADHLHEHFVHPVVVEQGRYRLPEAPGFGLEMKADSFADYAYPDGRIWRERSRGGRG